MLALAVISSLTNRNGVAVQIIRKATMSLSSTYQTNAAKETEGAWVTVGEAKDDSGKKVETRMRLSRMSRSNKKYTKALDRLTRPHRRAIEMETINPDVADEVFLNVFVSTILLGWENVLASDVTGNEDDKGFAPFSEANAKLLFKRLPDLYDDLQDKARKASLFRDDALETEAGN